MGYHLHHAIVVTYWNRDDVEAAHAKAVEQFPARLVTPVQGWASNAGASFAVFPDGSKEGWPASDTMDANRAAFIEWLRSEDGGYVDWIEVAFGGDGHRATIEGHGDDDVG
jgi:hypothetical protein